MGWFTSVKENNTSVAKWKKIKSIRWKLVIRRCSNDMTFDAQTKIRKLEVKRESVYVCETERQTER